MRSIKEIEAETIKVIDEKVSADIKIRQCNRRLTELNRELKSAQNRIQKEGEKNERKN